MTQDTPAEIGERIKRTAAEWRAGTGAQWPMLMKVELHELIDSLVSLAQEQAPRGEAVAEVVVNWNGTTSFDGWLGVLPSIGRHRLYLAPPTPAVPRGEAASNEDAVGHIDQDGHVFLYPDAPKSVLLFTAPPTPEQAAPIRKAKDVHGDSDVVLAADLKHAAPATSIEWVCVPREPTIGMCIAGDEARANVDDMTRTPAIYRAMLAAAPAAPAAAREASPELQRLAFCWKHYRWCKETSDAIEAVIAGIPQQGTKESSK